MRKPNSITHQLAGPDATTTIPIAGTYMLLVLPHIYGPAVFERLQGDAEITPLPDRARNLGVVEGFNLHNP